MGMKWETGEDLLQQFPTENYVETSALLQNVFAFWQYFLEGKLLLENYLLTLVLIPEYSRQHFQARQSEGGHWDVDSVI